MIPRGLQLGQTQNKSDLVIRNLLIGFIQTPLELET